MANEEHLRLVLLGNDAIAAWRQSHPGQRLDLRRADFTHQDLSGRDLRDANLQWADFRWADLVETNLAGADCERADFHKADMNRACLHQANLVHANLEDASLRGALFEAAAFGRTRLLSTDLTDARGLATVAHLGHSLLDDETGLKSGDLPAGFLAGCGTTRRLPKRITVLFLAANPRNAKKLRLDVEARGIEEMIRKSDHRDAVEFRSCWATRPVDVLQAINEHSPHVVHFSGHGSIQGDLVLEDDRGNLKLVSQNAMVQLMLACSGNIRLVFFNTCFSRTQAMAVVEHVDAAIGMNNLIGDPAAQSFASQFYSAIGFGKSLKSAFEQARARLMLEGIPEDRTPELFVQEGLDPSALFLVGSD